MILYPAHRSSSVTRAVTVHMAHADRVMVPLHGSNAAEHIMMMPVRRARAGQRNTPVDRIAPLITGVHGSQ